MSECVHCSATDESARMMEDRLTRLIAGTKRMRPVVEAVGEYMDSTSKVDEQTLWCEIESAYRKYSNTLPLDEMTYAAAREAIEYQLRDYVIRPPEQTVQAMTMKRYRKMKAEEAEASAKPEQSQTLREKLAEREHARWSRWQSYVFDRCKPVMGAGHFDANDELVSSIVIDSHDVEHWRRQIATSYIDLSEAEKNSDRKEADEIRSTTIEHLRQRGFKEAADVLEGE